MLKETFLAFIRHLVTTAAGAIGATGYASDDEMTAIIGGLIAAVGVAWSFIDKWLKNRAAKPEGE